METITVTTINLSAKETRLLYDVLLNEIRRLQARIKLADDPILLEDHRAALLRTLELREEIGKQLKEQGFNVFGNDDT